MPSIELQSPQQLENLGDSLVVFDFWADWCAPCPQLNALFDQLADTYPNAKFVKVEAEKHPEFTEKLGVTVVPTFLFQKNGNVFDKIEGANGPELANKVEKYNQVKGGGSGAPQSNPEEDLNTRLKKLVNYAPVMLFMKGTPVAPQCGFSRKAVDLLQKHNILFSSFNILSDEQVRQGLKVLSNWPTYPQLYVEGQLIGGLDIMKELEESGDFVSTFPASAQKGMDLNSRLEKLVNSAHVMLFMKGKPDEPKCGFSSQMCKILQSNNVTFSSFDILTDDEVRQGLKTFSNWPTYPQLYVDGKLIGGLDIVKELQEQGQLLDAIK